MTQILTVSFWLSIAFLASTAWLSLVSPNNSVTVLCPVNCTCNLLEQSTSLTIDCHQRLAEKDSYISDEINSFLLTVDRLIQLDIRNTKIKRIPTEVCNQIHLRTLIVSHNQIEELPDNCFTRLQNLQEFTAEYNQITFLQDGLFDGHVHLQKLSFDFNQIKLIGLHLFTNYSDLYNLSLIKLNHNRLTEIEPWMFIRARIMPHISVEFKNNNIKRFTNAIGWNSSCQPGKNPDSYSSSKMSISLIDNPIERYSDLLNALEFNSMINFLCWTIGTNMQIGRCTIICDCLEFGYFALAKLFAHADIQQDLYCSNFFEPISFQYKSAMQIPLEDLICEVSKQCPFNCQCVSQPSNSTFHVKCGAAGLKDIPTLLPNPDFPKSALMPKQKKMYQLDYSYNNISTLQPRDYYSRTFSLDLSNSQLKNITNEAWIQLEPTKRIYLHNNLLTTIPLVANLTNLTFEILSLYNNPMSCRCDQMWMKSWLSSVYDRLEHPSAIQCDSPPRLKGRSVLSLNDTEFCSEPPGNNFTLIIIINSTLIPLATFVVIIISILKTCKVKVFRKLGFHPFDRDECEGEEMDFDVFIAFAHEDSVKAKEILNVLEENLCKVCFHQRDFLAGQLIMDNITEAIFKSKRVLCLVSEQFIASDYCMEEFDMAFYHNIRIKRHRVIVMISSDFQRQFSEYTELYQNDNPRMTLLPSQILLNDSLTAVRQTFLSLKEYIARYTFVDSEEEGWKDQLLYAMPVNRLLHTST